MVRNATIECIQGLELTYKFDRSLFRIAERSAWRASKIAEQEAEQIAKVLELFKGHISKAEMQHYPFDKHTKVVYHYSSKVVELSSGIVSVQIMDLLQRHIATELDKDIDKVLVSNNLIVIL